VDLEITTVADDEVVIYEGSNVRRYEGLEPDTEHELDGVPVRTLPRPGAELLCTVATVNDVHFGETVCGIAEGFDIGPVFRSEPGEDPYPEVMNRGAIEDITKLDPAAVVVKGDLTAEGTVAEYERFLEFYRGAFGPKLHHVRGNHDAYYGGTFAADAPFVVDVPGARLAVLDTTIPGSETGQVTASTLDWLDDVAGDTASDDVPLLVFGHHHVWSPLSKSRHARYFGINPDDSERLIELAGRRPAFAGYFCGHTHRNRVRRFPASGDTPWVEVACVKDFPGSWAEYRVFDGGVLQVHRRISTDEALAWTEKTRGMFGGVYKDYALGSLDDRCFRVV
jgi:3',5'-cyclic AMP phosphodiesterase CpdA